MISISILLNMVLTNHVGYWALWSAQCKTEELNFKFYIMLINLNNHTRLIATVLERTGLKVWPLNMSLSIELILLPIDMFPMHMFKENTWKGQLTQVQTKRCGERTKTAGSESKKEVSAILTSFSNFNMHINHWSSSWKHRFNKSSLGT